MKKNYIAPLMSMEDLTLGTIIAQSGGVTATGQGLGYGGIDTNGKMDPSVKERNEWEDGLW